MADKYLHQMSNPAWHIGQGSTQWVTPNMGTYANTVKIPRHVTVTEIDGKIREVHGDTDVLLRYIAESPELWLRIMAMKAEAEEENSG